MSWRLAIEPTRQGQAAPNWPDRRGANSPAMAQLGRRKNWPTCRQLSSHAGSPRPLAGHQVQNVLVGEAEQQGDWPRTLQLLNDHRRGDPGPFELGCLEAHQGVPFGWRTAGPKVSSFGQGLLCLLAAGCAAWRRSSLSPLRWLFLINLKGLPGHIAEPGH